MKKTLCLFGWMLVALPLLAWGAPASQCDPTGTWYGGSDWKYMLIITPNADGSYTLAFQAGYDTSAFGYAAWTNWSGQVVRRGRALFETRSMLIAVPSPIADPTKPPTLELDIVHSTMRLKDGCDTIEHTIDVFGCYLPWTEAKVPFVAPLDVNFLASGEPLHETYHRMKQLK